MQRLQTIGSYFWSALGTNNQANIKPQDQIDEIIKLPFNPDNASHCDYILAKLAEFEKMHAELTSANLKIAAVSGVCLLLMLTTSYNSILSCAGYATLIAFTYRGTERSAKKEALVTALGDLSRLADWCHPDKTKAPNAHALNLIAAITPLNLDGIEKNKYLHLYDVTKTSALTTWSTFNRVINGRRFSSNEPAMELPTQYRK